MKQEIYRDRLGTLYTARLLSSQDYTLLGTIEIEPVKKVVTKEEPEDTHGGWCKSVSIRQPIPGNAKNIRILYDVEE